MKNITELIIRLSYNYFKLDWKLTGDTCEILYDYKIFLHSMYISMYVCIGSMQSWISWEYT